MLFESFNEKLLIGLDEEGFDIGDSTKYERGERESLSSFIMTNFDTFGERESRRVILDAKFFQGCQIKGLSVGREKQNYKDKQLKGKLWVFLGEINIQIFCFFCLFRI
ncbi:hypothetical protein CEXT_596741 [Caerostris extrusa]|uniref:Uncharacterized protein n=1 Tax=Caerostris extrusa TaxID=172846 RepID=A0AAV4UB43_CAEEX|nr:hypothetical protein CEXT_596741 [Caerostris extrusa]